MLLAFDLDKTLVTNDFQLPLTIERSIRRVREAGHMVTVLTGRPLMSARPFLDQLEVAGPYSVNHGALIMDATHTVIARRRILATDVDGILGRYLDDDDVQFSCVIDDTLWVRDPGHEQWTWAHTENRTVDRFTMGMAKDADKVVFRSNGRSETLDREVAEHHLAMLRYLWGDGFLEVVPPMADKGTALALIAERLQVPRSEVVAFGDGLNDLSMLEWAGRGVAVGPEAHATVLDVAQEHIASPEQGGVAAWLDANLG